MAMIMTMSSIALVSCGVIVFPLGKEGAREQCISMGATCNGNAGFQQQWNAPRFHLFINYNPCSCPVRKGIFFQFSFLPSASNCTVIRSFQTRARQCPFCHGHQEAENKETYCTLTNATLITP